MRVFLRIDLEPPMREAEELSVNTDLYRFIDNIRSNTATLRCQRIPAKLQ